LQLFWALIILGLDQATKYWVERTLSLMETLPVWDNVFHLTLLHNTGGAFGLFPQQTRLLIVITIFLFILIIKYYKLFPRRTWWHKAAFGLLIGGAGGNLLDRVFRGYVVDFLDFQFWPVFNIADMAITVAIFLFLWQLFLDWRAHG